MTEFSTASNSNACAHADVTIIGGGVAGLWCRWKLAQLGYGVLVLESSRLGDGQTVLSQGILHRGVKYAFSAQASEAARAAEEAAARWDESLGGKGGPDLRSARVLARSMFLWTSGGLIARATGAVASRLMKSHVQPLQADAFPSLLSGRGGQIYRVDEWVLDPASALAALASQNSGPIGRASVESITPTGNGVEVRTSAGLIRTGTLVLCAGGGNEQLLTMLGLTPQDWSQRRPLHMVFARGPTEDLYGHWIASASDKPRLTITTSFANGERVWYMGGEIAESGVTRDAAAQIDAARSEMHACFPSLKTDTWRFGTVRVDRAEGKDAAGRRPDGPVVREVGAGVIAVWPTKLVMAPIAAESVAGMIRSPRNGVAQLPGVIPSPDYALPPWQPPR
ncbi:MAG: FAD-binding oxidoreductase [Phycisphaerales bacterium]|nr:FAD-binding oxidoreductase [Planctomycetota bacterium]